ncbi:MAG: ABC transporter substrate-binding protein, partial [Thermomicrobiales bacterium]
MTKATRTQFTRRRVLQVGAGTGLSFVAPRLIGTDILGAAPSRQSSPTSFALATNRMPSDLDPHSAADSGSGLVLQGLFEGLIRLKAGTTDEYVPVLAESWAPNADQSVWTFRLRDGVRFHDGTPLDAEAARASFARLLRLQRAPSQVLG